MSYLPQCRGIEVVKALQKAGFIIHHQKGSHITLRHQTDLTKRTVVPVHKGKILGKGLLFAIIKDVGLTVDEFKLLL
ncbi:MAG: type II toxin-antitoxin system HicA family toxin [Planctomycetota bacterium]|nr:type II toxin-antitoxin system HicA family toxin [Planctomycetota bacterium]